MRASICSVSSQLAGSTPVSGTLGSGLGISRRGEARRPQNAERRSERGGEIGDSSHVATDGPKALEFKALKIVKGVESSAEIQRPSGFTTRKACIRAGRPTLATPVAQRRDAALAWVCLAGSDQ